MEQTYYKLVRNINGVLYSYNGVRTRLTIDNRVYIPNKWTIANPILFKKGYGLAVFSSLETLLRFENRLYTENTIFEVWKCKVHIPPNWKPAKYMTLGTISTLKEFMMYVDQYSRVWPNGTVLVQRIMLVEKIK